MKQIERMITEVFNCSALEFKSQIAIRGESRIRRIWGFRGLQSVWQTDLRAIDLRWTMDDFYGQPIEVTYFLAPS